MSEATIIATAEVAGQAPARAYSPGSQAELREVLISAPEPTLVPMGGGTMLERGRPPRDGFGLVDVRQALGGAPQHQADDLTVVAPAGMTIEALNAHLAPAGQWVPLDPPRPDVATVGGTLATGINGPLRSRYGLARDLVLGMSVMRADGEIVKAGGRVVKNVTGYDLMRLWSGSHGTLGIITEVALRALPRPAAVTLCARFGSIQEIAAVARRMSTEDVRPELADALCTERGWTFIVRVVESAAGAMRACMPGAEAIDDDALYRQSRDLGSGAASALVLSASTTFGRAAELGSAVSQMKASQCVVRPLAGVVRAAWDTTELPPVNEARHHIEALRAAVHDVQGTIIVDRMPPAYHEQLDPWGDPPGSFDVMRRVKRAYDASGRLNGGRFIGGI